MGADLQSFFESIGQTVATMPDTAIYFATMFFIFKMTMLLGPSWALYKLLALGINKFHDAKVRPKEIVKRWDLGDGIFLDHNVKLQFEQLMKEVKERPDHWGKVRNLSYIHGSDIEWMTAVIRKEIQFESQERADKRGDNLKP